MKTLLTTILLLLSLTVKAQQVDALYIPSQKSLVAYYNYKQIGCYIGGYYVTTFPHPYIYTTPLTIVNRAGLTYVNKNNTFSIMGGAYIKSYFDEVESLVADKSLEISANNTALALVAKQYLDKPDLARENG
jgi:hypothetical protein